MAVAVQDIRSRTRRTNGTRLLARVTHLARHHSGTTTGNFDTFWTHWNGTLKWGTGGYHEIILRDGTVQLCYNPEEITNGVGNNNSYTYHICVVGNGSFTAAQEAAWEERALFNMKRLNIPVSRVLGHREFPGQNTVCPGINMVSVRNRLTALLTPPKPVTVSNPKNYWYRVRKLWADADSQDSAHLTLDSAKQAAENRKGEGYVVFDEVGKAVHIPSQGYGIGVKDRKGEVEILNTTPYWILPNEKSHSTRNLLKGHGSTGAVHFYDIQGEYIRLGVGWVKLNNVRITKDYSKKEEPKPEPVPQPRPEPNDEEDTRLIEEAVKLGWVEPDDLTNTATIQEVVLLVMKAAKK